MYAPVWPGDKRLIEGIDGLRALAASAVVLLHVSEVLLPATPAALLGVFHRGSIGVDVFFTLSGFLITGILLSTHGDDAYYRSFYKRRVLRIFPLYYFATLPVLLSRGPSDVPAWSVLTFNSNWFLWRPSELNIQLTWSLSIEEQFYAVWPLLVATVPRRRLPWMILAITALSPLYRAWVYERGSAVPYIYTPGRVDALAWGALAAYLWHLRRPEVAAAAARLVVPALALFVFTVVCATHPRDATLAFTVWGYSAMGASLAVVLLAIASGQAPVLTRVLSARPLVALGQVSFGIYLLHPVAMSLTRNLVDLFALPIASSPVWGALTYVAVFAGTWGLAWVSFAYMERPILAHRETWAPYSRGR